MQNFCCPTVFYNRFCSILAFLEGIPPKNKPKPVKNKRSEYKKKNGKTLVVKPFLSGCGSRI